MWAGGRRGQRMLHRAGVRAAGVLVAGHTRRNRLPARPPRCCRAKCTAGFGVLVDVDSTRAWLLAPPLGASVEQTQPPASPARQQRWSRCARAPHTHPRVRFRAYGPSLRQERASAAHQSHPPTPSHAQELASQLRQRHLRLLRALHGEPATWHLHGGCVSPLADYATALAALVDV